MAGPPASQAPAHAHERMTQGDLDQVIKQHEMFFDKRPGGKRALLGKRDLSGLRMARRDLREIDLSGALLVGCDLSESNLQNAVLFGANLGKAKLIGSQLVQPACLACMSWLPISSSWRPVIPSG